MLPTCTMMSSYRIACLGHIYSVKEKKDNLSRLASSSIGRDCQYTNSNKNALQASGEGAKENLLGKTRSRLRNFVLFMTQLREKCLICTHFWHRKSRAQHCWDCEKEKREKKLSRHGFGFAHAVKFKVSAMLEKIASWKLVFLSTLWRSPRSGPSHSLFTQRARARQTINWLGNFSALLSAARYIYIYVHT